MSGHIVIGMVDKKINFWIFGKISLGEFSETPVNGLTQGFAACLIPSADFSVRSVMRVLLHRIEGACVMK
jgi:hypothetical protein